jgi:type IV pilus assembly protein PilF
LPRLRLPIFLIVGLLAGCAGPQEKPAPERPSPAGLNVRSAEELLAQGHVELALNKVRLALQLDPELAGAYETAGRIYERSDQPELAEKYYRRALQLEPTDLRARNDYGKYLCRQGRFDQAEIQFLKASESRDPRASAIAYTNAGLCALRIPDPDRGAQYLRAALEADPDMEVAYYQLAQINYQKGRYPQARRNLQSYLRSGKPTPKALLLGMRIERSLGDRSRFEQHARMLQEQFPESAEAQTAVGLVNEAQTEGWNRSSVAGGARGGGQPPGGSQRPLLREEWIIARHPTHYTIQLLSSQNEQAMDYVQDHYALGGELAYFSTKDRGETRYVLVYGDYPDRGRAERALADLPPRLLRNQPVVRAFGEIQRSIMDGG